VALTARVGNGSPDGAAAAEKASRALAELARAGITVDNFSLGQPSLDEVFLALTGEHEGRHDDRPDDRHDDRHDSRSEPQPTLKKEATA
jgi:ABC-2 type transport system ATP-binding protein